MTKITIDRSLLEQAIKALELALSSHGVLLLTDPPQDPWKTRGVEGKCRDAIAGMGAALEQPTVKDSLTVESSAERTLRQLGYTDCGGEVWKPPLGPAQPAQEPVAKLFETLPVYDTPPAAPEQAEPVPVQHTHQWFATGAMEPGQMRCIHCGYWGRDISLSAQPQTFMVNRLPADDTEGGAV